MSSVVLVPTVIIQWQKKEEPPGVVVHEIEIGVAFGTASEAAPEAAVAAPVAVVAATVPASEADVLAAGAPVAVAIAQ